jgi:4'-phosphopantetheinyl transferase
VSYELIRGGAAGSVWRLALARPSGEDADRLIADWATAADRVEAARYSRALRARQSLAVRALARRLLGHELGLKRDQWRLEHDANGRPRLCAVRGAAYDISFSHSRDLVACGVAERGRIGVDVEFIDPDRPFEELADAYLSPEEARQVRRDGARAFYAAWTMHEARTKAIGPATRESPQLGASGQAPLSVWKDIVFGEYAAAVIVSGGGR